MHARAKHDHSHPEEPAVRHLLHDMPVMLAGFWKTFGS